MLLTVVDAPCDILLRLPYPRHNDHTLAQHARKLGFDQLANPV
jgi:hypothetical protein